MKKILIYSEAHVHPKRESVFDISRKEDRDAIILHLFKRQRFGHFATDFSKKAEDKKRLDSLKPSIIKQLPEELRRMVKRRREDMTDEYWGFKKAKRNAILYDRAKNGHVSSAYKLLMEYSHRGYGYQIFIHQVRLPIIYLAEMASA